MISPVPGFGSYFPGPVTQLETGVRRGDATGPGARRRRG